MKRYSKFFIITVSIGIAFSILAYLFKIHFSDREEYGRYTIKYHILTPSPIKALSAIVDSRSEHFISIASDGPSPAVTIAIFRGVEHPESVVGKCEKALRSQSVAVVPSNTPVMEEPDVNLIAKIDIARLSATSGDITVTLINQGP